MKLLTFLIATLMLVAVPARAVTVSPLLKGTYFRNSYSSTNVTTSAYVEMISSLSVNASGIFIFDSSGQTLLLGVGSAGNEVVYTLVEPGGNGFVPLFIPKGSRVALKALSATASSGYFDITFFVSPQ